MADSRILSELIDTSLQKLKEFADTETVIGQPITTPGGVTVLPVSKVSMGFATGGLDYNGKNRKKTKETQPPQQEAPKFGGGGGTGVTVTPIAFLIISPEGGVELLPITSADSLGTIDKLTALLERSPDIAARLKEVFVSKRKKNQPSDS